MKDEKKQATWRSEWVMFQKGGQSMSEDKRKAFMEHEKKKNKPRIEGVSEKKW